MENKNYKVQPKTLPGFMELLPDEQIKFNYMIDKIRSTYEKYGFLPLDTPIIESADVLLAKAGGETEKQIYRFNKGENDLVLRFDLTVPLAKYVSIHKNELTFPFRRYQIGKVYRGERPQKGRFREFYQCDIDVIGEGELDISYDAEMPSIIYKLFTELGFKDFTIHVNNRKILNGFFEELDLSEKITDILRIIDKIDKIGVESVKTELGKLDISNDKIDRIIDFIKISGTNEDKISKLSQLGIENELFNLGIEQIKDLIKYAILFGIPEKNLELDLSIARGLDYYTGTVYETFLNNYRQLGSICSGGRYEHLTESYCDNNFQGVGISIGITRLFDQLKELDLIEMGKKSVAKVLVVSMDENIDECIKVATELRNKGIPTEVFMQNKKIKNKFKYADKLKIPYVIVIGEEEIKNNTVTLKNMETGEQTTVSRDELTIDL
ncbi:MAG: histidine--tRNA ligase [Clostridia bacterium]|nr:histidine--tRNA ligase [Clostridia bacterium]